MFFDFFYKVSRKIRGASKILRLFYGCDIPYSATIGKDVIFNHDALGVVIHPNAIIEDGAYIEHHVLLGQRVGGILEAPIVRKKCSDWRIFNYIGGDRNRRRGSYWCWKSCLT